MGDGLTKIQILFIIIACIVGALILFIFVAIPFSKIYHRKYYRQYYYKKVYSIALNNDYLLINNFVFQLDQTHNTWINHLLFGNKYIYVLIDYYYDGDVKGSDSDNDLVLLGKNGDKTYIDNPFVMFKKTLSLLSAATGVPTDYMIGIAIVNDECRMNISTQSKQFFMVQRKKLNKLIKTIEARPLGKIDQEQLQKAALIINDLNQKNKLTKQKNS